MDDRLLIFQDKMERSLPNLLEELTRHRAGSPNPTVLD